MVAALARPPAPAAAAALRAIGGALKAAGASAQAAGRKPEGAAIVGIAGAAAALAAQLEVGDMGSEEVEAEVQLRRALGTPALRARVTAGTGCPVVADGDAKATRNLAEHALLSQGTQAISEACRSPKRSQRGGRRRRGAGTCLVASSTDTQTSADSAEES